MPKSPVGYAPTREALLKKSIPPATECRHCGTELIAHAAYMNKRRRWEWNFPDDICYRCRRTVQETHPTRVYAIWFPGVKVLKIGKSTEQDDKKLVYQKNTAAKRKDGILIWGAYGDGAEEAFMQAYFQLRGYKTWKPSKHRMSEWISCPQDTIKSLVAKLDKLYDFMEQVKNAEL